MSKQILYQEEGRERIKEGIFEVSEIIKSNFGPKSGNSVFETKIGKTFSKDGYTILKDISFEDSFKNIGASLMKNLTEEVENEVGDGTKLAVILASSLIEQGIKYISAKVNIREFLKGVEWAKQEILKKLNKESTPIKNDFEKIKNLAVTCSNSEEIGYLIAQAFEQAKGNGTIYVEQGNQTYSYVEQQSGFTWNQGYISPVFITDTEKNQCVYENPYILITDEIIGSLNQLLNILNKVLVTGRPLVIIAKNIDGSALQGLVLNRAKNPNFKVCAIKADGFGQFQKDWLQDLEVLTNGVCLSRDIDYTLDNDIELESLGQCKKIIVEKDKTTIFKGEGTQEQIKERIETLKVQAENFESEYDKSRYQERISKLDNGITTLYIGGNSEIEIIEKKYRAQNTLNTVVSAIKSGIIPASSSLLPILSMNLEDIEEEKSEAFLYGVQSFQEILEEPLMIMLKNAGIKKPDIILNAIYNYDKIYNVVTGEYENIEESTIFDATLVIKTMIEKAVSVVSTFLTTECVIAENKK